MSTAYDPYKFSTFLKMVQRDLRCEFVAQHMLPHLLMSTRYPVADTMASTPFTLDTSTAVLNLPPPFSLTPVVGHAETV
jgi:hypothetical protein